MYKLIAFDCDGTLLNDNKKIDIETVNKIKLLSKKGIKVVLATSRPFCRVKSFLETLDLCDKDLYTVSFNGGLIINNTGDDILHNEVLSTVVADKIISHGQKYDLYTFIYEEDRIISNKYCDEYLSLNPDVTFDVADLTSLDLENLNIHKIIIHGAKAEILKARQNLDQGLNDICTVTSSNEFNIEFIPFGNSKHKGLEIIGKKLNIKAFEMIAFGDNENDLGMFNYVGYKVAMGNSIESLKHIADKVTLSNNDNGIAYAIDEMIEEGII